MAKVTLTNIIQDKIILNSNLPNLNKEEVKILTGIVVDSIIKTVVLTKKCNIPTFGMFKLADRKERKGINFQTKETITCPAYRTVTFKITPALKRILGKPEGAV